MSAAVFIYLNGFSVWQIIRASRSFQIKEEVNVLFTYFMPTKIIAGDNVVSDNPDDLILGKKAMIVTGKHSGKKSGALDDVTAVLEQNSVPYLVYDKIENNPSIESTAEGGDAARSFGADFIIAIGGGSPLDAAKAIAVYVVNEPKEGSDFELYDIYSGKFKNKPIPMAAIPTTAGTGSEVTPYSILTLHREKNKKSFSSPDVFFKTAFLDGKYIVDLPVQVLRNTAVDALSHLIEGFTNKRSTPASDYIALEGLRVLGNNIEILKDGGPPIELCTDFLWAATLGGMVIAQTGTTIVHSMGYPLTYYKNIPHGMANGLLLGEYMRRTDLEMPWKTDLYLEALNMDSIDQVCELLKVLLPCDVVFTEEEITEWTKTTIQSKNVKVCQFDVTRELEIDIYRKCLLNRS